MYLYYESAIFVSILCDMILVSYFEELYNVITMAIQYYTDNSIKR
jgi:hypothetical protein